MTCVLNETFAQEQRRRQLWFLFLILAELFLVWGLFALANARANLLYQTTYYDPFSPELYDPNPSSYIGATYQPTSIPSTATNAHTILSRPFFGTLTTYIRTSSNSFTSLLPYYDGLASSVPLQDDTSVIAHRYTLPQEGVRTYVQQFVDIIKHLYRHLLLAGLGQNSFAHGTLGESISGSSGQLYRVPT